jgi:uncharacterized membrane protein YoaK (UPF0700 family)
MAAYGSIAYRLLIISYMTSGIIWLMFIIVMTAFDAGVIPTNALQSSLGSILLVVFIPLIFAASVFFTFMLAPFSRTIWKTVRDT